MKKIEEQPTNPYADLYELFGLSRVWVGEGVGGAWVRVGEGEGEGVGVGEGEGG